MSSNQIGGFFNRLEASRKYLFGSLGVLGEANNSVISGVFITRGDDIKLSVDCAPDWESYEYRKLDLGNDSDKKYFEDALAWDLELDGKRWADGKNVSRFERISIKGFSVADNFTLLPVQIERRSTGCIYGEMRVYIPWDLIGFVVHEAVNSIGLTSLYSTSPQLPARVSSSTLIGKSSGRTHEEKEDEAKGAMKSLG